MKTNQIPFTQKPGKNLPSSLSQVITLAALLAWMVLLCCASRSAQAQCSYTLSPTNLTRYFSGNGGTAAVTVTAADGCGWTAQSNDGFIKVTAGGSGTGNGTVIYSVDANPSGAERTGSLTIAGQTFVVHQRFQGEGFGQGDVFVSTQLQPSVLWFFPDGTFNQALVIPGLSPLPYPTRNEVGLSAGMAFDSSGSLYVTMFSSNNVVRFDNHGHYLGTFGSGYDNPESIVFDANGSAYVGQAGLDQLWEVRRPISKFDSNGNFITNFFPWPELTGTDWIDLAAEPTHLVADVWSQRERGTLWGRDTDYFTVTVRQDWRVGSEGNELLRRLREAFVREFGAARVAGPSRLEAWNF